MRITLFGTCFLTRFFWRGGTWKELALLGTSKSYLNALKMFRASFKTLSSIKGDICTNKKCNFYPCSTFNNYAFQRNCHHNFAPEK